MIRDRLVPLTGAFNFRDLGGFPTSGGRMTRWGRLYRSDALYELTEADLEILHEIGLATIIDLRTPAELERTGRGLLAGEPVRYIHRSVIREEGGESQAAPAPGGDDLAERYLWYLDVGRQALVDAFEVIAEPASYPLVFHCTAGKDRTGVVAALLLDVLGVARPLIVEDYARTGERLGLIVARLRRAEGARMDDVPASRLQVHPVTMERFLAELQQRHGGAGAWLLEAGLPPASLDRLPELLLEPERR